MLKSLLVKKIPFGNIAIYINKSFLFIFLQRFQINKQRPKNLTMTKTTKHTKTKKMKEFTPELAEFIGKKVTTRAQAFKIVFAYVKKCNLQDPNDKQFFLPDKKMSKLFGKERIRIVGIHPVLTANMLWTLTDSRVMLIWCAQKYVSLYFVLEDCKKLPKNSSEQKITVTFFCYFTWN